MPHAHEAGWAHADGALRGPSWLREPADPNALVDHLWSLTATKPDGVLTVGGVSMPDLAREHGTPAYVLDEADFRSRARAFREAFASAQHIIAAIPGYGRHELRRCVENDHRFLLLVWWDAVESHEVGFRRSPQYQEWKRLLHHFYDPFPTVEHYVEER